ncbi:MAG: pilus assembly protein TadG-related protein [Chloroflexi bacterium]|nr:pilus assembly protein TadG-related protein [Chloroflexota bacterium]
MRQRVRSESIRSAQPGQILVIFALSSTVLLLFAALVADTGLAFMLRRQLQSAADAAARAGTLRMKVSGATDYLVSTDVYNLAVANGYTGANSGLGEYIDSSSPPTVLGTVCGPRRFTLHPLRAARSHHWRHIHQPGHLRVGFAGVLDH